MKLFKDMTEVELRDYFTFLARTVESELPSGPSSRGKALFFLVVSDGTGPGISQYVSNIERDGAIKLLRETADRLEGREDVTR